MSSMKMSPTICGSVGLLGQTSTKHTTVNMLRSANGSVPADLPNLRNASVAFLTEVDGQYILNIGPGDHTCERWIITRESLRAITLMGIKKLI